MTRTESGSGASPLRGLKMLDELTDQGNAVVVFEHKHEVIKTADCGRVYGEPHTLTKDPTLGHDS